MISTNDGLLKGLVVRYRVLRKSTEKARLRKWLDVNGHGSIVYNLKKLNITWTEFKGLCGYPEPIPRSYSLSELIVRYKGVRSEHEEAKSSDWFNNNGHRREFYLISHKYKIKWNEFKALCGYSDEVLKRSFNIDYSLGEAIEEYKVIRESNLASKSSFWICANGYSGLYSQVTRKFDLSWREFKGLCGYDEELQVSRFSIDSDIDYSLDKAIETYKVLRSYHPKCDTLKWLLEGGYNGLVNQLNTKHKLSWTEFKIKCGFGDEVYREDYRTCRLIDLVNKYKVIRDGNINAYSCEWMSKNGHGGLGENVRKRFGIGWYEFKRVCGYSAYTGNYGKNKYWTLDKCKENALGYATRLDWQKGNSSAYQSARKNGWLEECCLHMVKCN